MSFCLADAELRLSWTDDPTIAALQTKYADVLGAPPPPHATGPRHGTRARDGRRLDATVPPGEAAVRRGTSRTARAAHQPDSTAGHAAAVVFARKPNGSWRICYDYRGLNAITRPAVEPLPHWHIDALLDGTRGSRFFTKLDLASSYHQLRASSRSVEDEFSVTAGPI